MKITYELYDPMGKSFSVKLMGIEIASVRFYEQSQTWEILSKFDLPEPFIATNVASESEVMRILRQHVEEQLTVIEWPDEETVHDCPELKSLLKAEIDIIRKHLNRHMWFQHITDEQLAAMDFAKKFGWVMKELYCLHACKKRHKCHHAMQLRQGEIEENPEGMDK